MKEQIEMLLNYLIELYLRNEEQQLIFPKILILILRIQQSLLSISYIYELNTFSYVGLLTIFARPQQFLPQYEAIQYIVLILCILYVLNLFSIIPHTKYIGIFGQLLRCSLINFIFEYSTGQIQLVTHSFIIFISVTEAVILQGTLNALTINFQHTRFSILDFILLLLNYVIMILYSYQYSSSIIKILAIVLNILRVINQYLFSPNKNLHTKTILLTIQLATVYLSIMHIYQFEDSFTSELVLLPLIYNILYLYYSKEFQLCIATNKFCETIKVLVFLENIQNLQQLSIEKPKSARDKIIYSSLLMLQEHHYEAFLELSSIKFQQLNFLQKFKKKVIMKQCMNKIDNKIQIESTTSSKLALAVSSLMASEQSNYTIQKDTINILKDKIKCQQLLLQNQTLPIYRQYIIFIEKLLNIKRKLEKQYENFPCDKTQGILGFFYVEVMNDYLSANSLFSVAAMSDEKIKRIVTNQDIFSNKMIYIISTFDGDLTIKRVSNEAPEFLQKTNEQLIGKPTIYLIPPGIAEHHDKLIFSFLQKGQAKLFRKFQPNFLYNMKENTMQSIEFTFDIDLRNDFSFISVIQPTNSQMMSIIVNSSFRISCISDALISYLGLQFQFKNYIGMSAKIILPSFELAIQGQPLIENVEAHFPNFDDVAGRSTSSQSSTIYLTSYGVIQKVIDEKILYFIVTFEYFKKPTCALGNLSISGFSPPQIRYKQEENVECFYLVNVESRARIPYHETSQKRITSSYYKMSQDELDCSKKCTPNEVKLFSSFQENINLVSPANEEQQLLKDQKYFSKAKNQLAKVKISVIADKYSQEKEIMYQDDRSSQISSLQGARKSKFYRKYEIFTKISEIETFSINHKLFIAMLNSCIIFQLITQIIQLAEVNKNLTNLASDIDLLQIKNFVFQPMETFLVTRYTILNYNMLNSSKAISPQNYTELVKFPRSNLNLGYDALDKNLKQVFNRPELQDFLENTFLNVYSYTGSKIPGDIFNVTLRNGINILLNYQYTFKMGYLIDGTVSADSPYTYYSYKNYVPIKQLFSELNELVLQDTITRANYIELLMRALFIVCVAGLVLFFLLTINYFLKISKNINKYYQLLHNMAFEYVEYDQIRLKILVEKINKDPNLLFRYQFHLDYKEGQLENTNGKATSVRRNNEKLQAINNHDSFYYLFIIGVIILIAGNATLTFNEGTNYLAKYPDTAQFYKAVSDVGTDIPTMYAQREVLNGQANLWYYNQSDVKDLMNEITDAVARTASFLSLDYDFSKFLVSESFLNYFSSVQTENLCEYLPDELLQRSVTLCPIVMSSNMQLGLKAVLVYIINFINTEREINNFTARISPSYLVLEGAFLVSNIIEVVNNQFNIDLSNQTQRQTNSINVHNIVILILLFLLIIIISSIVKEKIIHKLYVVQRLVYLLPLKTLFLDDAFERNIRQLLQQN